MDELMSLLAQDKNLMENQNAVKKFEEDFFLSEDPLTEIMIRVNKWECLRIENLDFADKSEMFVN